MSDATLSTCRALAEVETQARRHLPSRVEVKFRHLIAWVLPDRLPHTSEASVTQGKAGATALFLHCRCEWRRLWDVGFSRDCRAYLGRGRRHAAWLREGRQAPKAAGRRWTIRPTASSSRQTELSVLCSLATINRPLAIINRRQGETKGQETTLQLHKTRTMSGVLMVGF